MPAPAPDHDPANPVSPIVGRRPELPGWLVRLAGLSDTPRRTAAAFALGVFLSFSPFFGFQIAIGFGTAMALRLNRMAVLIGLCTNLPWLMVPWYAMTTAAGAAVLGVPMAPDLAPGLREIFKASVYSREFWSGLGDLLWPFLWSFILGTTVSAALLGVVTYIVTARLISRAHAR